MTQNKITNLKSLLTYKGLSSGYSFRGKIKHIKNGDIRIIQLKDLENNYSSIGKNCFLIDGVKIKSKYFLESGDVLFIAKGSNNYALVYKETDGIPTIASSALFVLKVNKDLADPFYIAWYINQSKVQNYLKTNESGTYVTSINKAVIEEIPIELPPLKTQTKIAKIASLHNHEQILNTKILDLRNTLITNQLLNSIQNDK